MQAKDVREGDLLTSSGTVYTVTDVIPKGESVTLILEGAYYDRQGFGMCLTLPGSRQVDAHRVEQRQ